MPMGKTSERKTNTRRRGQEEGSVVVAGAIPAHRAPSLSLFYLARKKEKKKGSWMDKWIQRERKESS